MARKILFSDVASVASSARIEARRPTTNGAIIDGKTTMSRSGTSGSVVISVVGMWFVLAIGTELLVCISC